MPVTIRPATVDDIAEITQIYNQAGVGTTASYDLAPVTVAERTEWFEAKQRRNFPTLVAVDDGQTVGFASYGTFREKAGYDYTVEHSVYVRDGHRASGVGRMLMSALIDHARGHGVHVMVGALDGSNEASVAFHLSLGFVEVARMPEVGRKFGRWLDLVLVQLTFEGPDPA
ncbi:GNAT family N-acetyltransferase [Aestuariimicrobium ganziense]|uniref:GNAT family N-acetyltransferase n=1 Tax=Aestuariimicrobium ganziense TaxID=2773677 RepID=UPI00194566FD|nr:GNAT family N-acetyltransferase [Aestuariimicrobium ganziense]